MSRISLLILLLWAVAANTNAQDIRSQLRQIAGDLTKQIEAKGKRRVVTSSFLNLKNQETELGRYMADKFTIGLVAAGTGLQVTDRSQLAQLLQDNKLGADRVLDPKTIPALGKITGAEVIITGNYTPLDNSVDITVKAIELERGLVLAVAEGAISRTPEIDKLLNAVESQTTDPVPGREIPKPGSEKTPKPEPDCGTKHTCVVCITNKSAINIKAVIYGYSAPTRYIHPNETKCWTDILINPNEDHQDYQLVYQNDDNNDLKAEGIVVEPCKVYMKTFIK